VSYQISLFDGAKPLRIEKPIRLIELFAGIGAQAKALEQLGADFEHYRVCEYDKYAVTSYNAIHGTQFEPSDIREWHGADRSGSQLYKQAGNSIVVNCLCEIFNKII
jgi:DNA (cytosine-5)-methyltransferase 1